jgi:hypothetical protein
MQNRALFSALAMAFAVYGCDSKTSSPPPTVKEAPAPVTPLSATERAAKRAAFQKEYADGDMNCENKVCTVDVIVGPACAISAKPSNLGAAHGDPGLTIVWTIKPGPGAGTVAFDPTNGINPKNSGTWGNQFSGGHPVGATVFQWSDANTDTTKTSYGYNILVSQNEKACPQFDPTIINGY